MILCHSMGQLTTDFRRGCLICIYVTAGVYEEHVSVPSNKFNIMLIGDGRDVTVITGNRSVGDNSTTFNSATLASVGKGFIARDLTIENTAGAIKQQVVAVRVGADLSTFYRCIWKGYQDTIAVPKLHSFGTNTAERATDYIHSSRWLERSGDFALSTLYNGEYKNEGPGSNTSQRVTWPGYHVMKITDAQNFTVRSFISGDTWLPATSISHGISL
ncbi:hypothetical protein SUGI_1122530 [Cryptomeria japonica]|nr:hypothetical protein SUGI_1122530 [Cryptomeria japonica]